MKARSRGLEDGIGTNSHPEIRQTGAKKAHILNCTGLLNENKPQSHVFSVDRDKKLKQKENGASDEKKLTKLDRDKSQENAIGTNPSKTRSGQIPAKRSTNEMEFPTHKNMQLIVDLDMINLRENY